MKEIGGYLELEKFHMPMLHEGAIQLNCGRNCLAYLIKSKNITKIKLPIFLCDSVKNTCIKYGVKVTYYHINEEFLPVDVTLNNNEWLYVVNYYGQLKNEKMAMLVKKYKNVIADYAQAYFQEPLTGLDTIYTCRKFFGVPDGAFLYTESVLQQELLYDESFNRMHFLLGRYERDASEFYQEYVDNNKFFSQEPIKRMSRLTMNLLRGLDYGYIKERRTRNYKFLHEKLHKMNQLKLEEVEGAFAYPLLIRNGDEIRKKLVKYRIYIPTLWPNVLIDVSEDVIEYDMAKNILPIPCDQRYSEEELSYVYEQIEILKI